MFQYSSQPNGRPIFFAIRPLKLFSFGQFTSSVYACRCTLRTHRKSARNSKRYPSVMQRAHITPTRATNRLRSMSPTVVAAQALITLEYVYLRMWRHDSIFLLPIQNILCRILCQIFTSEARTLRATRVCW